MTTGEPAGTAADPMLSLLKGNNLVNCVIVVTRYFGGILLGTGGLVRAYSNVTLNAINKAKKGKIVSGKEYEIRIDYSNYQNFQYYSKKNKINILHPQFLEDIECNIIIDSHLEQTFLIDIKEQKLILKNVKFIKDSYIEV